MMNPEPPTADTTQDPTAPGARQSEKERVAAILRTHVETVVTRAERRGVVRDAQCAACGHPLPWDAEARTAVLIEHQTDLIVG